MSPPTPDLTEAVRLLNDSLVVNSVSEPLASALTVLLAEYDRRGSELAELQEEAREDVRVANMLRRHRAIAEEKVASLEQELLAADAAEADRKVECPAACPTSFVGPRAEAELIDHYLLVHAGPRPPDLLGALAESLADLRAPASQMAPPRPMDPSELPRFYELGRKLADAPDATCAGSVIAELRRLLADPAASPGAPTPPDAQAEAFAWLRSMVATSSRDWGAASGDALIYGVLVGWDCFPGVCDEAADDPDHWCEQVREELAKRHGWTEQTVKVMNQRRVALAARSPQPTPGESM